MLNKSGTSYSSLEKESCVSEGFYWINVYNGCNAVYFIAAKYVQLQFGFHFIDVAFIRSVVLLGMSYLWMRQRNEGFDFSDNRQARALNLRSLAGTLANAFYNLVIVLLPLSTSYVILNTQPFFISFLAFFILGDPVYKVEMIAILICFLCVVSVSFFKQDEGAQENLNYLLGTFLSFLVAIGFAATQVYSSFLKSLDFSVINTHFGAAGVLFSFTWILIRDLTSRNAQILSYSWEPWLILFFSNIVGTYGMIAQTIAFQSEKAGKVGIYNNIQVVYALLADLFIFGQSFSAVELLAALIVLATTLWISTHKMKQT